MEIVKKSSNVVPTVFAAVFIIGGIFIAIFTPYESSIIGWIMIAIGFTLVAMIGD